MAVVMLISAVLLGNPKDGLNHKCKEDLQIIWPFKKSKSVFFLLEIAELLYKK